MFASVIKKHCKGSGGIFELFSIAAPLVISQACDTVMMFTDRLFLSKIGPEYMNASMGGGITWFMFMTFFMGLINYTNALVAQHFGAGQFNRCPVAVTQGMIISLFAWPFMLLFIPVGHWLFAVSNVPAEQIEPQIIYFNFMMLFAGRVFFYSCISNYFSGISRTKVVMASSIVSMIINVLANYALIFGHWGFPNLGIKGAAIGTTIGGFAGVIFLLIIYFARENRLKYNVMQSLKYEREMMIKLLRFGYPAGLEFFLNLIAFNLLILLFHSFGSATATAVTIAFNWDMVSFVPLIGINIGVTSLVGRYMGAKNPDNAHKATMSGFKLVSIYSIISIILFNLFAQDMVDVFLTQDGNSDLIKEALPLSLFMVRLVSIYIFADSIGLVFSGALRGAGDTFITMCLSVGSHWIMLAIVWPLVAFANISPRTAWTTLVILIWNIGLAFFFRYHSGKWRNMSVVE